MIPGSLNPIIMGGALDGYQVQRSLRLRQSATGYMQRVFGTPTNNTVWTFNIKFKLGFINSRITLLSAGSNSNNYSELYVDSTGQLSYRAVSGGSVIGYVVSDKLFRDPIAEYDLTFAKNGTTVTAKLNGGSGVKGGSDVAWTVINTISSGDTNINSAVTHAIGARATTIGVTFSWDGLLTEPRFVDGQVVAPSAFGQVDPASGAWVSKAYTGTWGNNGTYLDYSDPTSTTTLMADRSGNGNNWTATNISLTAGVTYDSMLDVPLGGGGAERGNYCTANPLDAAAGLSIADANMRVTSSASGSKSIYGTMPFPATGKWYLELTSTVAAGAALGLALGLALDSKSRTAGLTSATTGSWHFYASGGGVLIANGTSIAGSLLNISANENWKIAADADNGKVWIGYGANWLSSAGTNTGNPATGANPTFTISPGGMFPFAGIDYAGTAGGWTWNSGQQPFAQSVPSGFKALHTGNLPTPAVPNAANAVFVKADTKANILTALAAARSGWTDYVDIIKSRSSVEAWGWRFSHLSGNEYATGGSVVYQANRSMTGSDNQFGCSLRIGANYGTAAGTVSHTTGAATTVTHNVGKTARQLILLFPRSGSAIKVYHPELTAGKLLDLCTSSGETTDTSIASVTSNAFNIGSGMASGTYDYLVISELSGLVKFGKHTGNSSADGPCVDAGGTPIWTWWKRIDTAQDWMAINTAVNPNNVAGDFLRFNVNNGEGSSSPNSSQTDFTASGYKVRNNAASSGYNNTSGGVYAHVSFLSTAFKNALAH